MKKHFVILWAVVLSLAMMALYCAVRADMDEPVKPEIEVETVTTNIQATIITWTKTVNGRQFTWGLAYHGSNTYMLFPVSK